MTRISGFMVVRDLERQGYPFIEAAAAALGVCDELVISDGYSTDRTWAGLLALRDVYGDRVRLYRDRWPRAENHGPILAEVTNVPRRRCRSEYCLSAQANEILHEDSWRAIRELPTRRPEVEIFALPYLLVMGPNLVTATENRRRLFRNIPDIVAYNGGHEMVAALPMRRVPTISCELPDPVYRYRALFPAGYIAKLSGVGPRRQLWDTKLRLAEEAFEATMDEPDPSTSLWARVEDYLGSEEWLPAAAGTAWPQGRFAKSDRAPAAVSHLLGAWRYSLDESIAWLAGSQRGRAA